MDSAEFKDAQNVVEVAEMILEDPFMDKVINPQVNDFKPVETEKDWKITIIWKYIKLD